MSALKRNEYAAVMELLKAAMQADSNLQETESASFQTHMMGEYLCYSVGVNASANPHRGVIEAEGQEVSVWQLTARQAEYIDRNESVSPPSFTNTMEGDPTKATPAIVFGVSADQYFVVCDPVGVVTPAVIAEAQSKFFGLKKHSTKPEARAKKPKSHRPAAAVG